MTNSGGRDRLTARRTGTPSGRGRDDGWRVGRVDDALGGQGDRTGDEVAVLPERDVDGPVRPRDLGELTGAVERVDDPDPPGEEPPRVVGGLLGEDGVAGRVLGEEPGEDGLRGGVAGVLERAAGQATASDGDQLVPGSPREQAREPPVGGVGVGAVPAARGLLVAHVTLSVRSGAPA